MRGLERTKFLESLKSLASGVGYEREGFALAKVTAL
jgi:hypothetical protein